MKAARPVRKGADGKSAPLTRGNSPAAYLTRRRSRAHGGLRAHHHHLPAPPGAQVEAGGGDDGARRPRRHRRIHHRPGAAPPLRRLRPPLRGDEPGEGQAVLPLDALRDTAVGRLEGQAASGKRRRGSPSASPAAPTAALPSGRPTGPAPPDTRWRTTSSTG